jgi:hypothetical protein
MPPRHGADAEIESGDSKRQAGMTSGSDTMNGRLPLRERAGLDYSANRGALAGSLSEGPRGGQTGKNWLL